MTRRAIGADVVEHLMFRWFGEIEKTGENTGESFGYGGRKS